MRRTLAGAILLTTLGCSTTPESPALEPLPFHVAILPVGGKAQAGATSEEEEQGAAYELMARDLDEALRDRLLEYGVAEVTLLDPPQGQDSSDNWWLKQADDRGADLLLDWRVVYEQRYESARNDRFWLNLPLFLLLGTLNLIVNDRTYTADAALRGHVVDLNRLPRDPDGNFLEGEYTRRVYELMDVGPRFREMTMDFIDRDGHKGATMFYSFFVPAAFLARSNDTVASGLQQGVTDDLATQVAALLQSEREKLLDPNEYSFSPQVEGWSAQRAGGQVVVRGSVSIQTDLVVEGMRTWRLDCGSQSANGGFGAGELDEDESSTGREVWVYPLDASVPDDPAAETVRLTLSARGGDNDTRSFTLPIDRAPIQIEEQ